MSGTATSVNPPTTLLSVTANLSGKVRKETLGGRTYLVAPISMLVPGVVPGSAGSGYYPPEEVGRDPSSWNHVPLVVYHPTQNGVPVSARDPAIIDKFGIGFAYRTRMEAPSEKYPHGRLAGEGWFDEEATKRVDMRVYSALASGKKIEVSTGLFLDSEQAPEGAVHNSPEGPVSYTFVAKNYRPDHLAILPDQTGACSIKAGCGVFNEGQTDQPTQPVLNAGNTGETSMPLSADQRNELVTYITTNCDCWKGDDAPAILNGMTDDRLTKVKQGVEKAKREEAVANAARKGFMDGDKGYTYDATRGTFVRNVDNSPPPQIAPPVPSSAVAPSVPTALPVPAIPAVNTLPTQPTQPPSMSQWMADPNIPLEVKNIISNATNVLNREKEMLINQLTSHLPEQQKKEMGALFANKSVDELRALTMLLPQRGPQQVVLPPELSYLAASVPATNTRPSLDQDDILPLPVMAWEDSGRRQPQQH